MNSQLPSKVAMQLLCCDGNNVDGQSGGRVLLYKYVYCVSECVRISIMLLLAVCVLVLLCYYYYFYRHAYK